MVLGLLKTVLQKNGEISWQWSLLILHSIPFHSIPYHTSFDTPFHAESDVGFHRWPGGYLGFRGLGSWVRSWWKRSFPKISRWFSYENLHFSLIFPLKLPVGLWMSIFCWLPICGSKLFHPNGWTESLRVHGCNAVQSLAQPDPGKEDDANVWRAGTLGPPISRKRLLNGKTYGKTDGDPHEPAVWWVIFREMMGSTTPQTRPGRNMWSPTPQIWRVWCQGTEQMALGIGTQNVATWRDFFFWSILSKTKCPKHGLRWS